IDPKSTETLDGAADDAGAAAPDVEVLATGMEVPAKGTLGVMIGSGSGNLSLGALVAFALLALFAHMALFGLPALDHMAQRLGTYQSSLPLYALSLMLGAGAVHKRLLLFDGLGQPGEKGLIITQLGDADTASGPLLEALFVLGLVAHQLVELLLAVQQTLFERRHAHRETFLRLIHDVLNGLESFGSLHRGL
ncbi:MAG TPA: hypothetical protein VNR40_07235, partial [Steroidobacter sp.]|nr:hypothetical protein [Steroidobacter sp.]